MPETMDPMHVAMRLRKARLDAGLQLSEIEQRTRISPSVLRWIDDGQFHRLPAGIYARSYVRAFAQAVGLDPNEIVASIEHELPPATDITGSADSRVPETTTRLSPEWLRVASAVIDAGILSTVYAMVLGGAAVVCGRPLADVLAPGLPAVVVVLLLLTAIYFVIFAGIEGRTLGMRIVGVPPFDVTGPVRLHAIASRALRVFVSEASFGAELASRRSAPRDVSAAAAPYGSRSTP